MSQLNQGCRRMDAAALLLIGCLQGMGCTQAAAASSCVSKSVSRAQFIGRNRSLVSNRENYRNEGLVAGGELGLTWVREESAVTPVSGRELSLCQLWLDFARVLCEWWEGKGKTSERQNGDEQEQWREKNSLATFTQRPRSIAISSHARLPNFAWKVRMGVLLLPN